MQGSDLSLPREDGWRNIYLHLYQYFWCRPNEIEAIILFQKHFQAKNNDVILATVPKSGTTWLKALTYAIVNRGNLSSENHPLLNSNPHDLVPFFEYNIYAGIHDDQAPDLSNIPRPVRLFGTHIPFASLPNSIKESNCKVIYICRNPFDTFVSSWNFMNKNPSIPKLTIEEAFDKYCNGINLFGPFWSHMLGYWNASKERPDKVLFLKYEDLKEDCNSHMKKVAEFLGFPFTKGEESGGVIENIIKLCSLEKMKGLEVNKSGVFARYFEKKDLFRKGEVGDWVNYLSPSMVEKLNKVMEEKLGGSGLVFRVSS